MQQQNPMVDYSQGYDQQAYDQHSYDTQAYGQQAYAGSQGYEIYGHDSDNTPNKESIFGSQNPLHK